MSENSLSKKQYSTHKSPSLLDGITLNNASKVFTARSCHFLPSVIIKKWLDFTLSVIFWLVCKSYFFNIVCTNKTLRAIEILFN